MLSINKVMLTGRLTRDPEIRYTGSGQAVMSFSIAVNRRFLDARTNEWREETLFLDCEAWGKMAERLGEVLRKGTPVYVEGRLRPDVWERSDGQKVNRIRVVAERVSPFEVPSRGEVVADVNGDYEANSLPPPNSSAGPPTPPPTSQQQKSPNSRLVFDPPASPAGGVDDDIPF